MLYALALKYDIDDIDSLAATSLTDNNDDKGIDCLHFIPDQKTAILIQGYFAQDESKPAAKSSKASDFNAAINWALAQPIDTVPDTIKVQVAELRKAITDGDVNQIVFWYVHNLDESTNVKHELGAVLSTAKSLLETHFSGKIVPVSSLEVGNKTLETWYRNKTRTIIVDNTITTEVEFGGYTIESSEWKAFHTTVSLQWLHQMYQDYGNDLFSANIRGYLGSKSQDINKSIKETCSEQPDNFWVYNNGITCLVHDYEYNESDKKLVLKGISIVNGAQTTGAIGSTEITVDGYLPIRFVATKKQDIWQKIIQYNNSQNKIFSSDFRSNDEVQKRLREEFRSISQTYYTGRRGGAEDVIKRDPNLIGTEKAAISLVAFHGDPYLTYHEKSKIWSDENYSKYYNNDLTAKHLVFTYSLFVAIENKKEELGARPNRTTLEEEEYNFLKKRGGMRLYLSAIGFSIEEILHQRIPNAKKLSFGNVSWKQGVENWKNVVDNTIMYCNKLSPGVDHGILNPDYVHSSMDEFKRAIASQLASDSTKYDAFKSKIQID
jgi:hypothetical protein